jgi:hypothetical protein
LHDAGNAADADAFARHVVDSLAAVVAPPGGHLSRLVAGNMPKALQALADCAHFLTILHGQVPSLFELASGSGSPGTTAWLRALTGAFSEDRRWLARLSVLTGASLDLGGLTSAEQVVRDQRDAMLTLATSSRNGCALGAAVALVVEWRRLRDDLPRAALALDIDCRDRLAPSWPDDGVEPALVDCGDEAMVRRAIVFGATQLASLHWQLFELLEARHAARLS